MHHYSFLSFFTMLLTGKRSVVLTKDDTEMHLGSKFEQFRGNRTSLGVGVRVSYYVIRSNCHSSLNFIVIYGSQFGCLCVL